MREHLAPVDGVPVRWLEHGSGPTVVLVHGLGTAPMVWRHLLPLLSGVRLLAYELTGYGDSIAVGAQTGIGLAAQAERLSGWLGLLGVERAVLVGHDIGAGVVQIAAVHRPIACSGLLLTNGVGYDSWTIPTVRALKAAAPLLADLPPVLLRAAFASILADGHASAAATRASVELHFAAYAAPGGAAALQRQAASLTVADTAAVSAGLPALSVPARVVWSAADAQRPDDAERLAADLGTTVRRIDGGKHCTPEDRPDVLAFEIAALVAEASFGGDGRPPEPRQG